MKESLSDIIKDEATLKVVERAIELAYLQGRVDQTKEQIKKVDNIIK